MASVTIDFPRVPDKPTPSTDLLMALGRLVIAWSSSEFYFMILLSRLMAVPDLSDEAKIQRAATEGSADAIVDFDAISAIYFSVESSRGRRDLVRSVAKARKDAERLSDEQYQAIDNLLSNHRGLAAKRNKFTHTAMARQDNDSYIFLDQEILSPEKKRTPKQANLAIRMHNNSVRVSEVHRIADDLSRWILEAQGILKQLGLKA